MSLDYWKLLARALEQAVARQSLSWTSTVNIFNPVISPFDSKGIPGISIYSYVERIHKHAGCSDSCFILAYTYIERAVNSPGFILSRQNIHRLLLAAMLLAIKFNDDVYANNKSYALIGGVELDEINILESSMLTLLQYQLFVDQEVYSKSLKKLNLQFRESEKEEKIRSGLKPLRTIASIESIQTIASNNEAFE
eukprot:TRINITY_DN1458_c0_g1_i10.p1 TRINITY_DN1458_c0_g1~~TRINITY_DN1458_c0_g1_i10.p1  ORF type:complete len:195 (-),score=39.20 TRINITY_DN1458_c0_g1_i10:28-612(-)